MNGRIIKLSSQECKYRNAHPKWLHCKYSNTFKERIGHTFHIKSGTSKEMVYKHHNQSNTFYCSGVILTHIGQFHSYLRIDLCIAKYIISISHLSSIQRTNSHRPYCSHASIFCDPVLIISLCIQSPPRSLLGEGGLLFHFYSWGLNWSLPTAQRGHSKSSPTSSHFLPCSSSSKTQPQTSQTYFIGISS